MRDVVLQNFTAEIVLRALAAPIAERGAATMHRRVEPGALDHVGERVREEGLMLFGMIGGEHITPNTRHRLDDLDGLIRQRDQMRLGLALAL